MTGSDDKRIRFRAGSLSIPLRQRSWEGRSIDLVARRDLQRYYTMVDLSLERIDLSEAEAALVCHALGRLQPATEEDVEIDHWQVAWAEVAEGIRQSRLDRRWQVDGKALVQKLRRLSPGEIAAIVDAAERFWVKQRGVEAQPNNVSDHLREVGLVRDTRLPPRRRQ